MMKAEAVPAEFLCPITHEIMTDPLMRRSGLTYERGAILSWLYEHNNACPITRDRLSPRDLVPNHALRGKIVAWLDANGMLPETPTDDDDSSVEEKLPMEKILCTCLISSIDEQKAKSKRRTEATKRPVKHSRGILGALRTRLGAARV